MSRKDVDEYFSQYTDRVNIRLDETRAYIESIFKKFVNTEGLSKNSITLLYGHARTSGDFEQFQNLGDWIFLVRSMYPESVKASPRYYDAVAQNSYYRCYVILDRKWPCFEELADSFPYFVEAIRN